jgi:hypothetical protein
MSAIQIHGAPAFVPCSDAARGILWQNPQPPVEILVKKSLVYLLRASLHRE